jgi:hypothetical protein
MIDCRTIELAGRRVLHVGTYSLDPGDGDPPEARVFLATGWVGSPPLPFGPGLVDIPQAALPAILEALGAIRAED